MKKHFASGLARTQCAIITAGLVLGLGVQAARAQITNPGISIGPSEALASPNEAPQPAVEHLFGDPGGYRGRLARVGIDLQLDYIGEFAGNVSGGLHRGSTYAGQLGFEADIDWNKLAGVPGLSTHVVIVNGHGSQLGPTIGDSLNQVQEIYGARGDVVAHLVYAYAEESLANGRVDIALGRMPLLNDFAASPLNCNFMNNSLCGNPKALPESDIGISSYPDAVWAGRVRFRPTTQTYVQVGLYEVNQNLYSYKTFRTGFNWPADRASGVQIPIEVAYEPTLGAQAMPGHYKLGFAYDSTSDVQYFNTLAAYQSGRRSTGNKTEFWALADQMVFRNGPGATDGLILLAGYVHTDPALSNYANQAFFGALYKNFWAARPQDTIGLLFNFANVSGALGNEEGFAQSSGQPIPGGATGVQHNQEIIELNYDIHVYRGVNFQPEFQYYFRPNGVANIKDAAIFGFKTHVSF